MSTSETYAPALHSREANYALDIAIPVYNEETDLEDSVRRLRAYLDTWFPLRAVVTIADNASTDHTWQIASRLAGELPGVRAVHLDEKGRGRALRRVWSASDAGVVAYMDVDLSTDLGALFPLVAPLVSGHSDIAIGSRLAVGSHVVRGPKRELISRCYNLILKTVLHNHFSDAQCGFKAIRADTARTLLPLVADDEWFFDTELLALGERNGYRIHEVPVDWVDDADSRVDIARTAADDLRGVWRLARSFATGGGIVEPATEPASEPEAGPGRPERSARIGGVSVIAYVALFAGVRPLFGALGANAVALAICASANCAAHRRFTVGARTPSGASRLPALVGAGSFLASLALTTYSLAAVRHLSTSFLAELTAVMAAFAVVGVARFAALGAVAYHEHLALPLHHRPPNPRSTLP